ncbi:unnamed protein product [Meganyctiphanes norvegica]|uniref:Uncharacterized protein n=1 Tax=Meganyctiphanes norvegica TaxID=48144 RepID=A0AAV2Q7Y4_MEGNR
MRLYTMECKEKLLRPQFNNQGAMSPQTANTETTTENEMKMLNDMFSNDNNNHTEENTCTANDLKTSFIKLPTKYRSTNRLELDTITNLIDNGLDPNLPLPDGQTPITFIINKATSHRWVDMVKLLLEKGASPHVKDALGRPLLSLLAPSGNLALISLAIQSGADINVPGPGGETPLLTSVHYRKIESIRYFLSAGSDPNVCSDDGNSALMWALISQNGLGKQRVITCVKILLEHGAAANFQNSKGDTPLMAATLIGETEVISLLVAYGADTNVRNIDGESALQVSVRFEQEGVVRKLLKCGANPDIMDNTGCLPLMEATSDSIIYLLLMNNANPNIVDIDGNSSLHFHARTGSPELCLALLEYGAAAEPLNKNGDTPFQLAVRSRSQQTINVLLDRGCNAASINFIGVSIVQDAIIPYGFYNTHNIFSKITSERMITELLGFIREEGATVPKEVSMLVQQLLEQGAEADHFGEAGVTPLMLAAAIGDYALTDILVSAGAPVNAVDDWGRSALAYACKLGHFKVVDFLLYHGSFVNTMDNSGNLPIFYAAQYSHDDIVQMLIVELAFFYVSYHCNG